MLQSPRPEPRVLFGLQVAADEAERMRSELSRRVEALEEREKLLKTKSKELEKEGAQDFLRRLSEAESTIGQVLNTKHQTPNNRRHALDSTAGS